jgi:hypothetical protein
VKIPISVTYSVCMSVALYTQHAQRMRSFISPSVACSGLQCFSTLSHKLVYSASMIEADCVFCQMGIEA